MKTSGYQNDSRNSKASLVHPISTDLVEVKEFSTSSLKMQELKEELIPLNLVKQYLTSYHVTQKYDG